MSQTPLLDTINLPHDLRALDEAQLPQVADELRAFLLESIGKTGGHFASNLGAVELTIALHYVYDTPHDHLVWDVGHQTYPHKILTGRKHRMDTMRQAGGLAGFPKRSESEYDAFGVGHSSTSIGAALGMAIADKLAQKNHRSVAIIGDGAMTAGQAFEALNNAGDMDVNLLVILNDNEMSISPNVGALPKYLATQVRGLFRTVKQTSEKIIDFIPGALGVAQKVESHIKQWVDGNDEPSLFANFGFKYTGPVDGHDVLGLVQILKVMRQKSGPQLLHIITKKGQGYKLAENDPVRFHAIGKFDPKDTDQSVTTVAKNLTYTQVFGEWLLDMAAADSQLIAITPAMCEGSGLAAFKAKFAERYFDVGIAEQHAVTFAAGLACEGFSPVVAIYSTFLQRAYDQLIHDVLLQNLPVLFAIDRAGIVGADGPTHAGAYDLSFLRCLPNTIIAAPSDENECRLLLNTCYRAGSPAFVRYPRGSGRGKVVSRTLETVPIGRGVVRREGERVAILAFGSLLDTALEVAHELHATLADMRFVKPLDVPLILQLAKSHNYLITLEENAVLGGAGSAVLEVLAAHNISIPTLTLGIPDMVTEHGEAAQILDDLGLSNAKILQTARERFKL